MTQTNYLQICEPCSCNECGWSGMDRDLVWSNMELVSEDEFQKTTEQSQRCPKCGSKDINGAPLGSMTMSVSK